MNLLCMLLGHKWVKTRMKHSKAMVWSCERCYRTKVRKVIKNETK